MKRKVFVVICCMLFFISALPIIDSSPIENNDVDISITAGRIGLDIGFNIHIRARKPENTSMTFYVNITHSSIIGSRVDRYSWNFTCDEYQWGKIFEIDTKAIFNQVNITVEVDTIIVSREGFSIGKLYILNENFYPM
jgi:hypothetical protein